MSYRSSSLLRGLVPVTEWPLETPDPPQSLPLWQGLPVPAKAGMLAGIGRKRG